MNAPEPTVLKNRASASVNRTEATRIPQLIRGHFGSIVFGNGEYFKSVEYVPERPQVTLDSKLHP